MLVAEIEGDWFIILRGLKDLRQVSCNGAPTIADTCGLQ